MLQRYKRARSYALSLLKVTNTLNLHYHNTFHSLEVHDSAIKLCRIEGISRMDTELVMVAALYHDTGYIVRYENNEEFGAEIAETALQEFGYSKSEVSIVSRLILATKMPQRPKSKLEKIMCDSDLSSLGNKVYFSRSEALRKELGIKDRLSWSARQAKFLRSHSYFTASAKKIYGPVKKNNLRKLEEKLQ